MAQLPSSITLEIVTPEGLVFSGEVARVSVPGVDGYLGILPGHAPLLSELQIGVISFQHGEEERRLFCSWGFVEVLAGRVSVLAEIAEEPGEIDLEQAQADKERAEHLLRSKAPETDYEQALQLLQQAVTRLQVAQWGASASS